MEFAISIIAEFTGNTTYLSLVSREWYRIMKENNKNIITGAYRTYKIDPLNGEKVTAISRLLRIAIEKGDLKTVRNISSTYTRDIPIDWDLFGDTYDAKLAHILIPRLKRQKSRCMDLVWFHTRYTQEYISTFITSFSAGHIFQLMDISSLHLLLQVHPNYRKYADRLLNGIVSTYYKHEITSKRSEMLPIINISHVKNPTYTIPWLVKNGYFPRDLLLSSIVNDDVIAFNKEKHVADGFQYRRLLSNLIVTLDAVNIYTAIYEGMDVFSPIHSHITNPLLFHLTLADKKYAHCLLCTSDSNILPQVILTTPFPDIKENAIDRALKQQNLEVLELIINKDNYIPLVIRSLQGLGMTDKLFKFLLYKGYNPKYFSYYLEPHIDEEILKGILEVGRSGRHIKIPRSVNEWQTLHEVVGKVMAKIYTLEGEKAPPNVWVIMIGCSILYDGMGILLTSLIREHASEIKPNMILKMRSLFEQSKREGGWDAFANSLIRSGIPESIVYKNM